MKKSDLIAAAAAAASLPKLTMEKAMDAIAAVARTALKQGDDVVLGDFGKLSAKKREAREARNPTTGATVQVPAKTVVKFKPSKSLADAIA